jgi:hypothetical protein
LVIEGGFLPEHVQPHPPLRVEQSGSGNARRYRLVFDPAMAAGGEQTILGGLKTKNVDVVVSQRQIGPCLAVSVKGTFNAFRNLTNRMEEAAGDCTNLHMAYPALVYGFLHVMRANTPADVTQPNDLAIAPNGSIVDSITRYHDAMARLTGRTDIRNQVSRYEAVALALVVPSGQTMGEILGLYPELHSPLHFGRFFESLYRSYDLRFVYSAPALAGQTRRREWSSDSPILAAAAEAGFVPRVAAD